MTSKIVGMVMSGLHRAIQLVYGQYSGDRAQCQGVGARYVAAATAHLVRSLLSLVMIAHRLLKHASASLCVEAFEADDKARPFGFLIRGKRNRIIALPTHVTFLYHRKSDHPSCGPRMP